LGSWELAGGLDASDDGCEICGSCGAAVTPG